MSEKKNKMLRRQNSAKINIPVSKLRQVAFITKNYPSDAEMTIEIRGEELHVYVNENSESMVDIDLNQGIAFFS